MFRLSNESSSSSVPDASRLAAMDTYELRPLSSAFCQVHLYCLSSAPLSVTPSDAMSSFILYSHRSFGLPLFLFPLNRACSALRSHFSVVHVDGHFGRTSSDRR